MRTGLTGRICATVIMVCLASQVVAQAVVVLKKDPLVCGSESPNCN